LTLLIKANKGLPFYIDGDGELSKVSERSVFLKFIDDNNLESVKLATKYNDDIGKMAAKALAIKLQHPEEGCHDGLHIWIANNEKYLAEYKKQLKTSIRHFSVDKPCTDVQKLILSKAPDLSVRLYSSILDAIKLRLSDHNFSDFESFLSNGFMAKKFLKNEGRLGVEFKLDPSSKILFINKVVSGSAAEEAGLVAGDFVLSINNQSTAEKKLEEIMNLVVGPPKTKISFLVKKKNSEQKSLILERRKIELNLADLEELIRTNKDNEGLAHNSKKWMDFIELLSLYKESLNKGCVVDHDTDACNYIRTHDDNVQIYKGAIQLYSESYIDIENAIVALGKAMDAQDRASMAKSKKYQQTQEYFLKEACQTFFVVQESKKEIARQKKIAETSGVHDVRILYSAGERVADYQKKLNQFVGKFEKKSGKKWSESMCNK